MGLNIGLGKVLYNSLLLLKLLNSLNKSLGNIREGNY